jgi:hypothetical protein
MTMTDAVLDDLLTVYAAGEASPDTTALLEARAREDERFRVRMEAARLAPAPVERPAGPGPGAEFATLRQTRTFIFLRSLFMAMGIAFCLAPLTFVWDDGGVRLLVWHEAGVRNGFLSVGIAAWVAWWVVRRQVRPTGL